LDPEALRIGSFEAEVRETDVLGWINFNVHGFGVPGDFNWRGRRRRSRDLWGRGSKISKGNLPGGGYLFSVRHDSTHDGIEISELIVASGDQALEGKSGEDGSGR
jgi:hypothetical protein